MKYLAALLLILATSGCLSPQGKVGDPPSTAAGAVSSAVVYGKLATWVESERCEDSDRFVKVSLDVLERNGIPSDAFMTEFSDADKARVPATDERKSDWAKRLRAMK